MIYHPDRRLSDAEVVTFSELGANLLGASIAEITERIGPFNASLDNDRGRIWYEWRGYSKTLILESFNRCIVRASLEQQPPRNPAGADPAALNHFGSAEKS
jgi:hypothetical protein